MKRRWLIIVGVVLTVVVIGTWLDPTYTVTGYLKGESFFQNRPTSYWDRALRSGDPQVQSTTELALKEGKKDALPVLVELVKRDAGTDWDGIKVRCQAAGLLGRLGPDGAEAVPVLLDMVKSPDAQVRSVAATALATIGRLPPESLPVFVELLKTDKLAAARALRFFGPKASVALEPLQGLLKDENPTIRWTAAWTVGKIGPEARNSVPLLIELLKDDDALVREHAAEALGDIGPDAKDAVEPLIKVLQDKEARVRRDAVRSLGQIGPAARTAMPAIRKLLDDPNERVRGAAARSLKQIAAEP